MFLGEEMDRVSRVGQNVQSAWPDTGCVGSHVSSFLWLDPESPAGVGCALTGGAQTSWQELACPAPWSAEELEGCPTVAG